MIGYYDMKIVVFIALFILFGLPHALGKVNDLQQSKTKIDAYTVTMLRECEQDQFVNLFVILNYELSIKEVEELRNIGCAIRSQAKNIITVNIRVCKIEQLINFAFVKFVELARPLKIEKEEK